MGAVRGDMGGGRWVAGIMRCPLAVVVGEPGLSALPALLVCLGGLLEACGPLAPPHCTPHLGQGKEGEQEGAACHAQLGLRGNHAAAAGQRVVPAAGQGRAGLRVQGQRQPEATTAVLAIAPHTQSPYALSRALFLLAGLPHLICRTTSILVASSSVLARVVTL